MLERMLEKKQSYNELIKLFIKQNQKISQSSVFQGNLYEYTVVRELEEKLHMQKLEKIGGAHDEGIDVIGKWDLVPIREKMDQLLGSLSPMSKNTDLFYEKGEVAAGSTARKNMLSQPLNIMVQCKAFTKAKISPKEIREVIGTFSTKVPNNQRKKSIALICSPHLLTKSGLKLINSTNFALIFLRIETMRLLNNEEYDVVNSGKLLNYYENAYASKLLENYRIKEWIKLSAFSI
ncbi:hypothetical protein KAFR_0D01540 [Kazachstania africana CBS 2517]|uniref:Required for respiratory growth protein 7, mitochondrial n=1 Tax=Kazachstania africana (strain ATCC 22294 / BCRC 22015 / CBS 2517 / CECT 1963 / NBRC 1671 / NRRL Y-8276) TaxID=1071382 RepID=H2ATV0_KAZAF|nr:hypothetical protein KAFR_0D01540 [Kazachstania africana CBS 2517]CCF57800.1 hypothetical protein KAFR_0D01540 [Kazachstania africana CBS 2517]